MAFVKIEPQPPQRAAEMLVRTVPEGASEAPYDQVAPGLYPGEVAVLLDDEHRVAVSVASKWLENGAGVTFTAWGRWIEEDGSTRLGPEGQHVETSFTDTRHLSMVELHGVPAIQKELMFAVLGEEPTLVEVPAIEGQSVSSPMIAWSDAVRANVNIKRAIALAAATGPEPDAGAILGI